MTDREILIALVRSLTLSDHMGDVKEAYDAALKKAGLPYPDHIETDDDIREWLDTEHKALCLWTGKPAAE